jgi:adiponectin receptor
LSRFPENWLPGKFCYYGSSHQLWHICVWAAGACWMEGMIHYFAYRKLHLTCENALRT